MSIRPDRLFFSHSGADNRAVSQNLVDWTNRNSDPLLNGVAPTYSRLTPTYNQSIGGRDGVMKLTNTGASTSTTYLYWQYAIRIMRYMKNTKWRLVCDFYIPSTNIRYHFRYPSTANFLMSFMYIQSYSALPARTLTGGNPENTYTTDAWFTAEFLIDASKLPNTWYQIFFAYQQSFAAVNTESIYIDNIRIEPYFLINEIAGADDETNLLPDGITFNAFNKMIFNPTVYSHVRDYSGYALGKISASKLWSVRFTLNVDSLSGGDKVFFCSVNSVNDKIIAYYRDSDGYISFSVYKDGAYISAQKLDLSSFSGDVQFTFSYDTASALCYADSTAFETDASPVLIGDDLGFFIGCLPNYSAYLSTSAFYDLKIWDVNLTQEEILTTDDIYTIWTQKIITALENAGYIYVENAALDIKSIIPETLVDKGFAITTEESGKSPTGDLGDYSAAAVFGIGLKIAISETCQSDINALNNSLENILMDLNKTENFILSCDVKNNYDAEMVVITARVNGFETL